MSFINNFLKEFNSVLCNLDNEKIEKQVKCISKIREHNGRIFFLGVGGSAANASHAVNDFRKLAGIECYCITDNVSEYSARVNDEGLESSFSNWLKVSKLNSKDCIYCLSVGGGNIKKNVSLNIVEAIEYALKVKAKVLGIVGREDGHLNKFGNIIVKVPNQKKELITPFSESFQSLILHSIVSHPELKKNLTKW